MIAQDTGSAIVGPARADLYFGAGLDAGKVAGRLRHNARFVMLVPKSLDPVARGRKLPVPDDAAVGEDRKTVSANRAVDETARGDRGDQHQADGAGSTADAADLRKPRRSRRPWQSRCRCPSRGRRSKRFRQSRFSVTCADTAIVDETPAVEFDSRIAGAAATQARPERRGARAVGERRQAGQAAAQTARVRNRRSPRRKPIPTSRKSRRLRRGTPRRRESLRLQSRSRRRWRRSAAASGRICRAGGRRSTPGSTCTA